MHKLMRKVFALPLLPSEDIPTAFRKLQEKDKSGDQRLASFCGSEVRCGR